MNYQPGTDESMEAVLAEVVMADAAMSAKQDQLNSISSAKAAFEAYWAGSASASVMHHYKRGAVKTVRANA